MRRHPFSAVDKRGHRHRQLYRRDLKRLSEGNGRQLYEADVVFFVHDRSRFSRQIDSGLIEQSELLEILIVFIHAEPQSHRDKDRITGIHRCLYEIFRPVSGNLMTSDAPVFHHHISRTVKRIVYRHNALFQRGRSRHRLKSRTGLIGIVDAAVPPHGI